jgi:NADH:ubiquinone oxidoreductase subunit 2 (subunit N)
MFLILFLIFAFFLKLGITPTHLYKIEVYKGINFISIFFYTTYYFFIFFLYFLVLILLNLNSFNNLILYIISIILIVGSFFVISLLFDVNYVKAFLAYSSIVNSLSFLIMSLSLIS